MAKSKNNIGRFQNLTIIFVWVLMYSLPLLFGDFQNGIEWSFIFKVWLEYSFVFVVFLLNHFILSPRLLFNDKRIHYFFALAGSLLLLVLATYLLSGKPMFHNQAMEPPPGRHHLPFDGPPRLPGEFIPPFANSLILGILLIGFDTGLVFYVKWMRSEKNKLVLEKENAENKMTLLQHQISPHFFMNTLNNIHALVDINTDEAKEAIIKLSKLMSYMLYESQTEKISIQKELDFIKSYVELMRIRFTDEIEIRLDIPEILPNISIPPLLTISFIENAFKHGISYDSESFVRINFRFTDTRMYFETNNSSHPQRGKAENSGIGLENSRNRLELIYADDYELSMTELPEKIFSVKLNIPI